MKIKALNPLLAFLVLISMSCKKEPQETCLAYGLGCQLLTNPLSNAGFINCETNINDHISSFKNAATDWGLTQQNVKSVSLGTPYAITVKLPANAAFTFADFSLAEVVIDGLKVATLPNGASGTSIDFTPTVETNVKSIYFSESQTMNSHTMNFRAQTKKAIPSSTIQVSYTIRACK
jgi:hypothetical protein